MQLTENISLKDKHTFHLQSKANYWVDFQSSDDLEILFSDKRFKGIPVFTIGSGSNLLFNGDFHGLLLHSAIESLEIVHEDSFSVLVRVGSGVVWDDFVVETVKRSWSGAENLSGIPGEVGATPVQNIGAYGKEVGNFIVTVEAFNRESLIMKTFNNDDCQFNYRDSIFKNQFKNKFVICYVTFRLSKVFEPNIRYGDVSTRVLKKGEITLDNVRQTILEIRREKLPDPEVTGNAGSFFMNPVISSDQYEKLKVSHPDIPGWKQDSGLIKVSAAWLIEKVGWKGGRFGNAGVHDKQALVLINTGNATSSEIIGLSEKIMGDVQKTFNITLHPEVLII